MFKYLNNKTTIKILGVLVYVLFAIMSLMFYKERVVFIDLAFHAFCILKDGAVAIQNFRFVSFLTQLFPLVTSFLDFDLSVVMKSYSLSFVVVNAVLFFLIMLNKGWRWAIVLLLFDTLLVRHTFYWTQSELQVGIPLLIYGLSLIEHRFKSKDTDSKVRWIDVILPVILFGSAFSHPLVIFPITFIYVYFCIKRQSFKHEYFGSYLMFLAFYFIKYFFFKTSYDSSAMSGVSNILKTFPDYFYNQSSLNFYDYLVQDYYVFLLAYFAVALFFLIKKKYLMILFITISLVGYFTLVNVSYPDGPDQFYIENLYLPATLFLAVPISFDIIDDKKPWFTIILGIFILIKIFNIYSDHTDYTNRVNYLRSIIEESEIAAEDKIVYREGELDYEKLIMNWGFPYEVWLLSTEELNKTKSLALVPKDDDKSWAFNDKDKFLVTWGFFKYSELPKKYFIFEESNKTYHYKEQ